MVGEDDDDEVVDESMDTDVDADPERATPASRGPDADTVAFEGFENNDDDDDDDEWEERNMGTIYEKTIGELGDVLGGPPIGIITDDWGSTGADTGKRDGGFVESDEVMDM